MNRNHPYQRKNNNNTRNTTKCLINGYNAHYFIHPYSMHNTDLTLFEKPKEIGFVLSEKRLLESKARNTNGLRYLALPDDCSSLNFDLTLGFSNFVDHIPHQHFIDVLLKWIIQNKQTMLDEQQNKKALFADFICWRGLLTTVLTTPYEKQKDWMFSIVLYKGTHYLCEIETDLHKTERLNMDEKSKNFTYWGFKFESYITSDLPDSKYDQVLKKAIDDVPDPENNYGTVVKAKIAEYSLVYAAEIDCCLKSEHKSLEDYCELKTSKGKSINDLNFEKNPKFFKWFIQSHLVGTEQFQVGLRDDYGIINKIISVNKSDIALKVSKRSNEKLCFNFLKGFLDLIKQFCSVELELYIAKRAINSDRIEIYKVEKGSDEYNKRYFMHSWYTDIV